MRKKHMNLNERIRQYLDRESFLYRTSPQMQQHLRDAKGETEVERVGEFLIRWSDGRIDPETFYEQVAEPIGGIPLYDLLKSRCRPFTAWSLLRAVELFNGNTALKTIADIGSATGLEAGFLAQTYSQGKVIVCENSKGMIQASRQRFSRQGVTNVDFFEGDMDELPRQYQGLDGILCIHSIPEGKAFREAQYGSPMFTELMIGRLKNLRASLATKGKCVAVFPQAGGATQRAFDRCYVPGLFDQAGFSHISMEYHNYTNKEDMHFDHSLVYGEA